MILNADIERAVRKLNGFNKSAVGRFAGKNKSVFCENVAVIVVKFITMAVSLGNFIRAVATFHGCSLGNYARICAETECTSLVNVFTLTGYEVDNLVFTNLIKFTRVCIGNSTNVSCVFDNGNLHAETNSEIGDIVLSCILCGKNHTLNASAAESAGNDDSVKVFERILIGFLGELLGIYPVYVNVCVERIACMAHCFGNREICVMELNILADKTDMYNMLAILDSVNKVCPLCEVCRRSINIKLTANDGGEVCLFKHERCFIKIRDSDIFDYAVRLNVAEHGNFLED